MFEEGAGDVGAVARCPGWIAKNGEACKGVHKIERAWDLHMSRVEISKGNTFRKW